jgi:hypothetical protein
VRAAGAEAGVHRKGRGLIVGHAGLCEDVAQVFGMIQREGAGQAIAGDVHAQELGEVALVLNFEPCTKLSHDVSHVASFKAAGNRPRKVRSWRRRDRRRRYRCMGQIRIVATRGRQAMHEGAY